MMIIVFKLCDGNDFNLQWNHLNSFCMIFPASPTISVQDIVPGLSAIVGLVVPNSGKVLLDLIYHKARSRNQKKKKNFWLFFDML